MGLLSSERGGLSKIWYWTVVIALAFTAMGVAGQTTQSTQTPAPLAVQEKVAPDILPTSEDTETVDNATADVETQRHFDELRNELRRELLDDRAETINWWLAATAIFLTFFGIVVVLGGYFGFGRFREIEAEAKKYAEEARELVEKIRERKKEVDEAIESIMRTVTGGDVERPYPSPIGLGDLAGDDAPLFVPPGQAQREPVATQEAEEAIQEVRQNPEASPIDRAIADAYLLQRLGRIDEAIEKWRSIANVTEGSDNDLAARAWLSVGYLLYERGGEDAGNQ